MPEADTVESILGFLAQTAQALVTWLLVVSGWLVVSEQSERRENWKHVFSRIQDLRKQLIEIEMLAVEYHTKGFCPFKLRRLIRMLSALAIEASQYTKAAYLEKSTTKLLIDLRRACSYINGAETSYKAVEPYSIEIEQIATAKDALDRAFIHASISAGIDRSSLLQLLGSAARRVFRQT